MDRTLLVIDLSNLFFRAFHGMRASRLSHGGLDTWAIVGTIQAVASVVKRFHPSYLLVAVDGGVSEYRRALYPGYKANRKKMDPAMKHSSRKQLEEAHSILAGLGCFSWQEDGVEADDVIATTVRNWQGYLDSIIIVSGDKDLRQLVNENVVVFQPALGGKTQKQEKWYDRQAIIDEYGVEPVRLIDLWALTGDSSDGLPGVPGVGPKTARTLIEEYGTAPMVAASDHKKVLGHAKDIALTYRLIELAGDIARCDFDLEDLRWDPKQPNDADVEKIRDRIRVLGLERLQREWDAGILWSEVGRRVGDLS